MDPRSPPNLENLKNLISTIRGGRTYTIKGKEERRGASRERIKVLVEEVWSSFSLGVVVSDEWRLSIGFQLIPGIRWHTWRVFAFLQPQNMFGCTYNHFYQLILRENRSLKLKTVPRCLWSSLSEDELSLQPSSPKRLKKPAQTWLKEAHFLRPLRWGIRRKEGRTIDR